MEHASKRNIVIVIKKTRPETGVDLCQRKDACASVVVVKLNYPLRDISDTPYFAR
jgi:hypothetical protein